MSAILVVPIDESMAVCPQCCHANPPTHHFCENCNAPLSAAAAILPAWRPWAEGYLVRRAVREADSWLVLIGMWLSCAPSILLPVFLATDSYPWTIIAEDWTYGSRITAIIGGLLTSLFCLGGGALFGLILFLSTRSFLRNRRQEITTASSE